MTCQELLQLFQRRERQVKGIDGRQGRRAKEEGEMGYLKGWVERREKEWYLMLIGYLLKSGSHMFLCIFSSIHSNLARQIY